MQNSLKFLLIVIIGCLLASNAAYAHNDKAEGFLSSGKAKLASGNHREAIADLTRAIELEPKLAPGDLATAFFSRGEAKRLAGDSQGSREDFVQAIEIDPTPRDAEAYRNRGNAKSSLGDRNGAIEDMKKAASLGDITARNWLLQNGADKLVYADNEEAKCFLSNGKTKLKAGNYRKAIAELTKAISFEPKLTQSYLAMAYFNRGIAKQGTGDSHGSREDFLRAIELDPTPRDAEAYLNRGTAKSAVGDRKGAAEDMKMAASLGDLTARKWLKNNRYK
jgi:tetratricopeptide (TPR) repeat protein